GAGGGQAQPGGGAAQRAPAVEAGRGGGAVLAGLRRAEALQRRRLRVDADRGVGGETGLLAGQFEGPVEAAQLVDQAVLVRVGARPDPAPRQLVDAFARHAAALGDPRGEVVVDLVEGGVDALPLRLAEVLRGARHAGVLALRDAAERDADAVEEAVDHGLAGDDADRAGDRPGLRDDGVGGHRDVVAAGRGDVAHGDDHGLAGAAGEDHLAPDRVGRDRRAARAVDAEDDRLDVVVLHGGAERRADRVRAHRGPGARQRTAAAAAAEPDRPVPVDEGDGVLPSGLRDAARDPVGAVVAGDVAQPGVLAELPAQVGVDLVAVAEPVDEVLLQGLARQERAAVHQLADLVLRQVPAGGDRRGDLLDDGGDEPPRRLLVLGRVALARDRVRHRLVLVPLAEPGLDARLLQRAREERLLQRHADQADLPGGLEVDPVEGGGEVVGDGAAAALAVRLGPRDGELARLPQRLHGLAQFLDEGQPDAAADLDDE